MYPKNDVNSTHGVRLVDLQTGELLTGRADELLDHVFAASAAEERSGEPFGEPRVPDGARSALLGKTAISHRAGEKALKFAVHADLVRIGQIGGDDEDDQEVAAPGAGGRRGAVMGFSRRSRSRLMQECAMVRDVSGGFFLTVTFPDLVVSAFEDVEEMARWAKKPCLDALLKRLPREYKSVGYIWRMELMDRKSGEFKGLLVPHFHLMIFGVADCPLMAVQDWLRESWSEVVGLEDEDFLLHGTNAWVINNRRHVMAYASKYAAKCEGDQVAAGRRWGKGGKLDQSPAMVGEITVPQLVQFKRYERALLRSRGRGGRAYARVLARLPVASGGFLLGLGDLSDTARSWRQVPTVIRMLRAVGVEV